MKKINFILFVIVILFVNIANGKIINNQISMKYSEIFENKFLTNDDVKNYKYVFNFQKKCLWKKRKEIRRLDKVDR